MSPSERTLHELNLSLNITRIHGEMSALGSTLARYRTWLHTIPAHKSYAPAYYAYLCRSYPSGGATEPPDYEQDAAEKALSRVAEMDAEIARLAVLAGCYEAALAESRRRRAEEEEEGEGGGGWTLREGLRSYRAALVPLMMKGMEGKEVFGVEKALSATGKEEEEEEEGKGKAREGEIGEEGEVGGKHEDDSDVPFPAAGGLGGLLSPPHLVRKQNAEDISRFFLGDFLTHSIKYTR